MDSENKTQSATEYLESLYLEVVKWYQSLHVLPPNDCDPFFIKVAESIEQHPEQWRHMYMTFKHIPSGLEIWMENKPYADIKIHRGGPSHIGRPSAAIRTRIRKAAMNHALHDLKDLL